CNRRTSLTRRISDLGLGISPLADKKARRIAALLPCRPRRRLFRGWRKSRPQVAISVGLRWRFQSASGGDFRRPRVAITICLGGRCGSGRAPRRRGTTVLMSTTGRFSFLAWIWAFTSLWVSYRDDHSAATLPGQREAWMKCFAWRKRSRRLGPYAGR